MVTFCNPERLLFVYRRVHQGSIFRITRRQFAMALRVLLCGFFVLATYSVVNSQQFVEYEILSGSESLVDYGMDSTWNWWAITQPFEGQKRLTVNSEQTQSYELINTPTFSPDGEFWTTLGIRSNQWRLVTNFYEVPLEYNHCERAVFAQDSRHLAFVGYLGREPWLVRYRYQIEADDGFRLAFVDAEQMIDPIGDPLLSQDGKRFGYVGQRGDGFTITLNGVESDIYDELKVLGFWADGRLVFAGRIGDNWRVYRGEEILGGPFVNVREGAVSPSGDNVGFVVSYSGGDAVYHLSEGDREASAGKVYDSISDLVLHPYQPLYAYSASRNLSNSVVFVTTEYVAGEQVSKPVFSYDGSELTFIQCNTDCFMNVNGVNHDLQAQYDVQIPFAVAPGTNTFAYANGTTLVIRHYLKKSNYAGMIVDEMLPPRYNRFDRKYQMLGRISERLYLLEYVFK